MLFDERKFPYHLMLQKFVECAGQDAFFDTFTWALTQGGKVPVEEGLEHPFLPEKTGEFLDSWLMLLEKMVNPKTILESPHVLPAKLTQPSATPFDPVKYLIRTHRKTFEYVMQLWNKKPLKVYGERMSESVLTILCHILRGEAIIQEKLSKEKVNEPKETNSSSLTVRSSRRNELEEQGICSEHLQQLTDMGFSRELAMEALLHASTLEHATDYLLTHPSLTRQGVTEWDMSEEDQMIRAIAMSLDENAEGAEPGSVPSTSNDKSSEPMPKELIDQFTKDLLPGCLSLLETLPETVYRVCDLLLAVCQRNGEEWSHNMLRSLISEINTNVNKLLASTEPMTSADKRSVPEWASQISQLPEAFKAANMIHLFSLIFEDKRNLCASLVSETNLIDNLVQLTEAAQNAMVVMSCNKHPPTPKWLAPVVLLIDLYDKSAVASARRYPLLELPRRVWRWFDERSGKWTVYTLSNNKIIDDAYKNGESFVRVTAGRRKYIVNFGTMVQINEETGNWRPIMFVNDDKAMDVSEETLAAPSGDSSLPKTPPETLDSASSSACSNYKVVKRLENHHCTALIRACVGFISVPVEAETLHAVMRLVLRLTRNYEHAALFEELSGVKHILALTQSSGFTGFTSLATLVIRHTIEEPNTLRQTMERVIRATLHNPNINCKEMHYILRVLGPAACRNSELFLEITMSILRISLLPQSKREEEESRLMSAQTVQTLRLLPSKLPICNNSPPNPVIRDVIHDLMSHLTFQINPIPPEESPSAAISNTLKLQKYASLAMDAALYTLDSRINRESSSSDLVHHEDDELGSSEDPSIANIAGTSDPVKSPQSSAPKDEDVAKKHRPLLTQSAVMRLLAELIRSYPFVAKMIADHVYPAGQTDFITEDCTALSFVLDYLLPFNQNTGDKNCPALTRVLIAAISSCNNSPDAQTTLVNEVKSALHRALALPESSEKHSRVQAILGVINTMIDSCPTVNQAVQQNMPSSLRTGQSATLNNMVKIMLRRGIVNDLARISHSLDFSSPHMAITINAALKPLETMSKIINLPSQYVAPSKRPKTDNTSSSNPEAMEEDAFQSGDGAMGTATESAETQVPETVRNSEQETEYRVIDIRPSEINDQERGSGLSTYDNIEENTNNEGVVIEESVHFDLFNESHSRSSTLIDEVIRNEHNNVTLEVEENHENVITSNGAESGPFMDRHTESGKFLAKLISTSLLPPSKPIYFILLTFSRVLNV